MCAGVLTGLASAVLRSVDEALEGWYPGRCDCVILSIGDGRFNSCIACRDTPACVTGSEDCKDDPAEATFLKLLGVFDRVSRMPSTPDNA